MIGHVTWQAIESTSANKCTRGMMPTDLDGLHASWLVSQTTPARIYSKGWYELILWVCMCRIDTWLVSQNTLTTSFLMEELNWLSGQQACTGSSVLVLGRLKNHPGLLWDDMIWLGRHAWRFMSPGQSLHPAFANICFARDDMNIDGSLVWIV